MSILKLHKPTIKTIIIGEDSFKFESLSAKQYINFLNVAADGDGNKIANFVADIVSSNLVGENVTSEEMLETFSIEELVSLGITLIESFVGVEEAGKH